MNLSDAVEAAQRGAAATRAEEAERNKQKAETEAARQRDRCTTWIQKNLAARLMENPKVTQIVLDLYNESDILTSDAYPLAAIITQETKLVTSVERRATCGPGDDHFTHAEHVIIDL